MTIEASAFLDTSRAESVLRDRHAGQRILLAEDNPVNAEVVEILLDAVGLSVETVTDGKRAVAMALAKPFDVVLMDVQMPEMDGLSACRIIRANGRHAIPVIAMTADASPEDRRACTDSGMNDLLAKPVKPAMLYAMMLQWLTTAPKRDGDLRDHLADIEGFDCEAAYRSVAGQSAVLARVLRRFIATYRRGLPELLDLQGHEHDVVLRWRGVCHSARGALAAIGAALLVERVVELERDLGELQSLSSLGAKGRRLHESLICLADRLEGRLAGWQATATR